MGTAAHEAEATKGPKPEAGLRRRQRVRLQGALEVPQPPEETHGTQTYFCCPSPHRVMTKPPTPALGLDVAGSGGGHRIPWGGEHGARAPCLLTDACLSHKSFFVPSA